MANFKPYCSSSRTHFMLCFREPSLQKEEFYGTEFVTVSVSNYNGLSGLGFSGYYGEFSWGRISLGPRGYDNEYPAYTNNGYSGIHTGSTVTRKIPLKYQNYL